MLGSQIPSPYQTPYGRIRVFLHWLSAAIILWACCTGFISASLPKAAPARHFFDILNPQLGTLLIPFFLWRSALYLRSKPWAALPRATGQERLAVLVHSLLYATVTIVLLSGLLIMPKPWVFLGFIPMPALSTGHAGLVMLHDASCMGLSGLVLLHLAAVVYHVQKKYRAAASTTTCLPRQTVH